MAVAQGRPRDGTEPDRRLLKTDWDNDFVLRCDVEGGSAEWREGKVARPEDGRKGAREWT